MQIEEMRPTFILPFVPLPRICQPDECFFTVEWGDENTGAVAILHSVRKPRHRERPFIMGSPVPGQCETGEIKGRLRPQIKALSYLIAGQKTRFMNSVRGYKGNLGGKNFASGIAVSIYVLSTWSSFRGSSSA